jgi:hypothetical protein
MLRRGKIITTMLYDDITRIIHKYGIQSHAAFRADICSLLDKPDKYITPPPPNAPPAHIAVTQYDFVPRSSYDKAMKFIREHNNTGWFSVTDIPDDLFSDFMTIADIRKEIEFDTERDCQFIRVVSFSKSRGLCLK